SGSGIQRWIDAGWLWNDGSLRHLTRSAPLVEHHVAIMQVMRRTGPGDGDRAVNLAERYLMELYYARTSLQRAQHPPPAIQEIIDHCRMHYRSDIDFHAL